MYRNQTWLDRVPFGPVCGVLFGLAAAFLVTMTPGWLFERLVSASGLPSLLEAARPPLGDTARILASLVAALGLGGGAWALGSVIERKLMPRRASRSPAARGERIAPATTPLHRKPIFAEADLGAPLMSDEAMEVARNELILEAPLAEPAIAPVTAEAATPAPEADFETSVDEAIVPEPAVRQEPIADAAEARAEGDSISGLMGRLESALERRHEQTSAPPFADATALRRALGRA